MDVSAELIRHEVIRGRHCTRAELEAMSKGAYRIGSRAAHGKEGLEAVFIGTLRHGNRLYDLYQDEEGFCWYDVRVVTPHGIVSEFEAIFGHPEKERRVGRKWRGMEEGK